MIEEREDSSISRSKCGKFESLPKWSKMDSIFICRDSGSANTQMVAFPLHLPEENFIYVLLTLLSTQGKVTKPHIQNQTTPRASYTPPTVQSNSGKASFPLRW
jgi:hypothetical protein